MLSQILPQIKTLDRKEKIILLKYIVDEIAKEQGIKHINEQEKNFWLDSSQVSLEKIWDNSEDDVYNELL